MSRQVQSILEKVRRQQEQIEAELYNNPPINRMTLSDANSCRQLTHVGDHLIRCDLPCFGPHIRPEYSRQGRVIAISRLGLAVPGQQDYIARYCLLGGGNRLCIMDDTALAGAIETKQSNTSG